MGKTRGVHETTPEIRNRMVGMYEAGLGLSEIAAALNCSQRTVKRWLNRFDKEGTVETRDRCGRKRATTQEQDEAIIRLATQTPIAAAKAVLPALGLNCSVDTIRERLHRAGIHNWSPSKKHIQKMPIVISDGAGIQQAIWRPTGTQLGKNKLITRKTAKDKANNCQTKKKASSQKMKAIFIDDSGMRNNMCLSSKDQPNFSFSLPPQNMQIQPLINEMHNPPAQSHTSLNSDLSQYNTHQLSISHSQSIYHHHPSPNVSQNWPLDLVQGSHQYTQSQQNSIHAEQHSNPHIQVQSKLTNHHEAPLAHQMQTQIQSSIHLEHHNPAEPNIDTHQIEHHQKPSEISQGKLNESQDIIINVCSDVCSNSYSSCNENSQDLSVYGDNISVGNNSNINKRRKAGGKTEKKKGGKVKGTLETSIEIRNRMIGMSEAGLSTLSIALAINRSERTVKRWLDRWHREGNVQTKERRGRRRITTKEQDDAIVAMATQQPLTAAKYVAPALGLKCSVDTIRERLHKAGIHSWKVGKKRGEGNAVCTVHLWQPSGNRSSKVKLNGGKKKKCQTKKQRHNPDSKEKQYSNKQKQDALLLKIVEPSINDVIQEAENIPFQNQSQLMQTTHDFMSSTSASVTQLSQHPQTPLMCSQVSASHQSLQTLGSMMQPRPDCRLTLPTIVPPILSQTSGSITYPSCMLGNSHTGHIEQADSMNYEPYIWSF